MPDQVWHPYTLWEDWQAGMWNPPDDMQADIEAAATVLGVPKVFLRAARIMLVAWPRCAEHNLTDHNQNRRSWIGQATCCHHAQVPESATRNAWWTLTDPAKVAANVVAGQVITEWERAREEAERPALFTIPSPRASSEEQISA